jgi:type IV secretion system protein TrbJ
MILVMSLGVGLLPLTMDTAEGQLAVVDAGNLVQNTMSALNTLKSTLNEATMIANQAQTLLNQAKNLQALPTTIRGDLTSTIGQYMQVLQQAQGLTYQFSTIQAQFQRLYPQHGMSMQAYLTSLPSTSQATYYALQDAMRAQSALDRLLKERTQLDTAMSHSAQASGALQAQQAATEVQGIMVEQLNGLQEVQAATGRAQATMLANQTIADAAARHIWQDRLHDWGTTTPVEPMGLTTLDGKPLN